MNTRRVVSVAFDGPNRVGKGTQIRLLNHYLQEVGIKTLILRGDGSRPTGQFDLNNTWWEKMNPVLHSDNATSTDWRKAYYKLTEEMIALYADFTRNLSYQEKGVLIIDRFVMSRMVCEMDVLNTDMVYRMALEYMKRIHCIPLGALFHMFASKQVLFSRLEETDPKYEFRRGLIVQKGDWYDRAYDLLPREVKSKVVRVDGTLDPKQIHLLIKGKVCELL